MNTEPAPAAARKVLVIDDSPIIQRAVFFALRDHGYKVLMCGEVAEAMKIIRHEKPDVILVDLAFPPDTMNISAPVDGFFAIDWIRRTPEVAKNHIMIISGTEPAQYKDRAAAAGIKTCLKKPLNKEELLAAVQSAIGENSATSGIS